jgi:hypothetical protein
MNPHRSVKDVASEIQGYIESHPAAADTIEGVMQWWLPTGDASLDAVETALNRLVKQHILERVENKHGPVIYRVRAA